MEKSLLFKKFIQFVCPPTSHSFCVGCWPIRLWSTHFSNLKQVMALHWIHNLMKIWLTKRFKTLFCLLNRIKKKGCKVYPRFTSSRQIIFEQHFTTYYRHINWYKTTFQNIIFKSLWKGTNLVDQVINDHKMLPDWLLY